MRILVLGGAGYIGSHAVYELIDQGHDVIVVDNLTTGHLAAIHKQATFYKGDIRDKTVMKRVFEHEHIDAVMHFAALSLVGESMEKPLSYYDNNVYGTQILLEVMIEHGVDKLIFSSTAATYGEPDQVPITENMPTSPMNPYGESKLAMENMIAWTAKAHDIRYVSLRYFNVAGARPTGEIGEDHHPETHLIPIVLQTALGKRDGLTIFGNDYDTPDGTCIRDYIHVVDLIKAHLCALNYLNDDGENHIFNLGNHQGFSVRQIVEAAQQVTGKEIPTKIGARRLGDPPQLVASSHKAQTILGWKPTYTDIHDIIEHAWHWHQSHPNGYETYNK